ncbi:MAG: hypothetical protein LBT57_03020 [Puniceicoccales bacterium]|jgi:hypothetical protein|nr:hypothetical protein [Puniceicoccales bacterium]
MDRVNPADFLPGTLGALAPNLDDPNCPYRNPFNPDKTLEFYECEMRVPDEMSIPAKPTAVENPGAIPSAKSLGISAPPPDYMQPVFKPKNTAIHPIFTAPDVPPLPGPRNMLTPESPEKVLRPLPDYVLHPVGSISKPDEVPPFSGPQYLFGRPEYPQAKAFPWPTLSLSPEQVEWLSFRDLDENCSPQCLLLKQAFLRVLLNPVYAGWRADVRLHEALEQALRSAAMDISIDGDSALQSDYFSAIFSRLNNGEDGSTRALPDWNDPAWHVLQFCRTIAGYSQSDLYAHPELLEQFQALLTETGDVPYTIGNTLLAASPKTVNGISVISETLGVNVEEADAKQAMRTVFHPLTDKVSGIEWSYEDKSDPENPKLYSIDHGVAYLCVGKAGEEEYIAIPNSRLRYDERGVLSSDGNYVRDSDGGLYAASSLHFKAKRSGFSAIDNDERQDYLDQKISLFVLNRGEFAKVANASKQYVCKDGIYYSVLGITENAYNLSDGTSVPSAQYKLFYRARIGEESSPSYVYGTQLYRWQEEVSYALQSECRAKVHYEDYRLWSQEPGEFTRTDDVLYTRNALGEYTPISDVKKLYIATTSAGESPSDEPTTTYLRIEFPERFYYKRSEREYLYVPHPNQRYNADGILRDTGTYIRTEEEGYFNLSSMSVQEKKRFIQLYDSTYRKNGETYEVAANGNYAYGQMTRYVLVGSRDYNAWKHVKHEGDFSSSADDAYAPFSNVRVKGDDDHYYLYSNIYLRGLQTVTCTERQILVQLAEGRTGPAALMVVPSLPQQHSDLVALATGKQELLADCQVVGKHLQEIQKELQTFTKEVDAFRAADRELEEIMKIGPAGSDERDPDWANAGEVEQVAGQILRQLDDIKRNHGSAWRQYGEFIIETLKAYKPSEDSSIIFSDRCRQIDESLQRVARASGFVDDGDSPLLTRQSDFFGRSLVEVFVQCQQGIRPDSEEDFLRLFRLTQALAKEFNDLAIGWEETDAQRSTSQVLVTQRQRLQRVIAGLQALDWLNFRSLIAQQECFGKTVLLEHAFANCGELTDDLVFSPAEVDPSTVLQATLPEDKAYYRSVKGTFHLKASIHIYASVSRGIVTLDEFALVGRYNASGVAEANGMYIYIDEQLTPLMPYDERNASETYANNLTPISFADGQNFASTKRYTLQTTYAPYASGSFIGYDCVKAKSANTYFDRMQNGEFYMSHDGGTTRISLQALAFYTENADAAAYVRSDGGDYLCTDAGNYVDRSSLTSFFTVTASTISLASSAVRYSFDGDYYTEDSDGDYVLVDGIFYEADDLPLNISELAYGSQEVTRLSLENSYQPAGDGTSIEIQDGGYANIADSTFYFHPLGATHPLTVAERAERYSLNYVEDHPGGAYVAEKEDHSVVHLADSITWGVYADCNPPNGPYIQIDHPAVFFHRSFFPKGASGNNGDEPLYDAEENSELSRRMADGSFRSKDEVLWYFSNGVAYVDASSAVIHDGDNNPTMASGTDVYTMGYQSDDEGTYYKGSDELYHELKGVAPYYVDTDEGDKLVLIEDPTGIDADRATLSISCPVLYFPADEDPSTGSALDISVRYTTDAPEGVDPTPTYDVLYFREGDTAEGHSFDLSTAYEKDENDPENIVYTASEGGSWFRRSDGVDYSNGVDYFETLDNLRPHYQPRLLIDGSSGEWTEVPFKGLAEKSENFRYNFTQDEAGPWVRVSSDSDAYVQLAELVAYYRPPLGGLPLPVPNDSEVFTQGDAEFSKDFNVIYCVSSGVSSGQSIGTSPEVIRVDTDQKYSYTYVKTDPNPPNDLWGNPGNYYVEIGGTYYVLSGLQEGHLSEGFLGVSTTGGEDKTDYVYGYAQSGADGSFHDTNDPIQYRRGGDGNFYLPAALLCGFEENGKVILLEMKDFATPTRYAAAYSPSDSGTHIRASDNGYYPMTGNEFHHRTADGPVVNLDRRFTLSYRYTESATGNLIEVPGRAHPLKIATERRGANVGNRWEGITEQAKFYERQGGFTETRLAYSLSANTYVIDTEGLYQAVTAQSQFYSNEGQLIETSSSNRNTYLSIYRKMENYSANANGNYLCRADGTYVESTHIRLGAEVDRRGIRIENTKRYKPQEGGAPMQLSENGDYFRTTNGDYLSISSLRYYADTGERLEDLENPYFETSPGSAQYALFSPGATYLWFEGEAGSFQLRFYNPQLEGSGQNHYYRYDIPSSQVQESYDGTHWMEIDAAEVVARWNVGAKYFKDAVRQQRIALAYGQIDGSMLGALSGAELRHLSPRHPFRQFIDAARQYLAVPIYQVGQSLCFFRTSDLDESAGGIASLDGELPTITVTGDSSLDSLQTLPLSTLSTDGLHYKLQLQDLYNATIAVPTADQNKDGKSLPISLANIVSFAVPDGVGTIPSFSSVVGSSAKVSTTGLYRDTQEAIIYSRVVANFHDKCGGASDWSTIKYSWNLGASNWTYRNSFFWPYDLPAYWIRGWSNNTQKQAEERWCCEGGAGMRACVQDFAEGLSSGKYSIEWVRDCAGHNRGEFTSGSDASWCNWESCHCGGSGSAKNHSHGRHFHTYGECAEKPNGSTVNAIAKNLLGRWFGKVEELSNTIILERDTLTATRRTAWATIKANMESFMACFANLGQGDFRSKANTGYDVLLNSLSANVASLDAGTYSTYKISASMEGRAFVDLSTETMRVVDNFRNNTLKDKITAFTNALAACNGDKTNVDILATLASTATNLKTAFGSAASGAELSKSQYFSNLNTIITRVNATLDSVAAVANSERRRLYRDMLEAKIDASLGTYFDWRTNATSKKKITEQLSNYFCGGISEVTSIRNNVIQYLDAYQILDPSIDHLPELPKRLGFGSEGDTLGDYRGLDANSPYIRVDPAATFSFPFRGTLTESEWQTVRVLLDQLPCTGDSTAEQFLENRFQAIQSSSSNAERLPYYQDLATLLQAIHGKISTYVSRNQAGSDVYATGLCTWYNHVVDLTRQQLRRQLQLHINMGTSVNTFSFPKGWDISAMMSNEKQTIGEDKLADDHIRYLRHISFETSNNQFLFILPEDVTALHTTYAHFSDGQNSIPRVILKNIAQAQSNLQSEIDYYRKLNGTAQLRYDLSTLVNTITRLKAYCQQISGNAGYPEETRSLYKSQVASLETLQQFFHLRSLQKELEKAYDVLCASEQRYYDWRVNKTSRDAFLQALSAEKNSNAWATDIRAHINEIYQYAKAWTFWGDALGINGLFTGGSNLGNVLKHRLGIFGDLQRDQYACIQAFNALTHLIQSYYPRNKEDLPKVPMPLLCQVSGRAAPAMETLSTSLDLIERYYQSFKLLCTIRPFFDVQGAVGTTGERGRIQKAYNNVTTAMNHICGPTFANYGSSGIGKILSTYILDNSNYATLIGEIERLIKQNPHWRHNSQELTRQLDNLQTKKLVRSGGQTTLQDTDTALLLAASASAANPVTLYELSSVKVNCGKRTILVKGETKVVDNMLLYIQTLRQDILGYKSAEDPYYVSRARDEELRQRIYDALTPDRATITAANRHDLISGWSLKVQGCYDTTTASLASKSNGNSFTAADLADVPSFEAELQSSFSQNRTLLTDFSAEEIERMQLLIRDRLLLLKDSSGTTLTTHTIAGAVDDVYKLYALSNLILGQNKGTLLPGDGILDLPTIQRLIPALQSLVAHWNQADQGVNLVAYKAIAGKGDFDPKRSFCTGPVLEIIEQLKDVASNGDGYSAIQRTNRRVSIAENIFSSAILPLEKLEWDWTEANRNTPEDALTRQGCYSFTCGGISFIAAQMEGNTKIIASNNLSSITVGSMNDSTYPDLHGVFYRSEGDGIPNFAHPLEFDGDGVHYFTRSGAFFVQNADGEERHLPYDEQGYVLDPEGHILSNGDRQSYRYDRLTGSIVQIDTASIGQSLGKLKINASYSPFFKALSEYTSPEALYLSRPDTAEAFFNELSNIAVAYEQLYSTWKAMLSALSQEGRDLTIAKHMVQFSNMLSQLRDRMMRHDVPRYQERQLFSSENYLIDEIDDQIKPLFNEGFFERFSHLARVAFDFYEVAHNLAYAEGKGLHERVNVLLPSYEERRTLYENALQSAIGKHGNFTTLLQDSEKLRSEAESELSYNVSQAATLSDKTRLVAVAAYARKKHETAQKLWEIVQSANYIKQCIDSYCAQSFTPTKAYAELATMMESGVYTSEIHLMDLASVCASTIRTQQHEYRGWGGDSTDVGFYLEVLDLLQETNYFHNSEELPLISSPSLQAYIRDKRQVLEDYARKLRTYELHAGMKGDGFFAVAEVGGREIIRGGTGLRHILQQHPRWFFSKAEQQILIQELRELHQHIDQTLALYGETGPLAGQLDVRARKAIQEFQDYLGSPENPAKSSLLESVISFETFDLPKFKGAVDYKRQAWQLLELEKNFNSGKMSFDEYKSAIEKPELYGGPLNPYIDEIRRYITYLDDLKEYQKKLLPLTPQYFYFDENLKEWKEVPVNATDAELDKIENQGGQSVRLIGGYDSFGQPVRLEQEDSTPEKPIYIYASSDALWHGKYSHLTWQYQMMAILYEKFTTQRWKIQEMLNEVQESNEKLAEANRILAQINTVQAAATKAGEGAKGVIPIDIQFYFQEHQIQCPSSNFTSEADMLYYQEHPFGKRSDYLINERKVYPTGAFAYLMQGLIKDKGEGNTLPETLKVTDWLELGSMRYIYHQQDEFSESTDITAGAVDSGSCYFGLGNLSHLQIYHGNSDVQNKKLWKIYWEERKYYHEHPQAKLKSPIKKFIDNYVRGNIGSFKGEGMSPFPSDSIGENSTGNARYRLKNTAPATNEWAGAGHYKYTAQRAAEAGGLLDTAYREDVNSKGFMEALELVCHQKFYETSTANLTEPWYDWNAYLMIYKIEAMSDVYGYEVTDIAMSYLLGEKDANKTRASLAALQDPNGTRAAAKERVYSRDEIIDIMACIDGETLLNTPDYADVPMERKEVLTYFWSHSGLQIEDNRIRSILDACMSAGATNLGADEVALWSENLRIYIEKLTKDQETTNTFMQRLLQRCNETTSLATQLQKVFYEGIKQITSNIR